MVTVSILEGIFLTHYWACGRAGLTSSWHFFELSETYDNRYAGLMTQGLPHSSRINL